MSKRTLLRDDHGPARQRHMQYKTQINEKASGEPEALLVELRGFEPLTLSMPWRCATSCAIAPNGTTESLRLSASGQRDSDPRSRPWQGRALPTKLCPHVYRNHFRKATVGYCTPKSIIMQNRPTNRRVASMCRHMRSQTNRCMRRHINRRTNRRTNRHQSAHHPKQFITHRRHAPTRAPAPCTSTQRNPISAYHHPKDFARHQRHTPASRISAPTRNATPTARGPINTAPSARNPISARQSRPRHLRHARSARWRRTAARPRASSA